MPWWEWPKGPTSSSGPCPHCPALWSLIGICHRIPESAAPPLVPCAFQRWEQVHSEPMWQTWKGNIVQHDQFGGGSLMVWGGTHRPHTSWRPLGVRMQFLDTLSELILVQWVLLVHNNARPHVIRVSTLFLEDEEIDTTDWPPRSTDLHPTEHLWDIMFYSVHAAKLHLRLLTSWVILWSRFWGRSPRTAVVISISARSSVVSHAHIPLGSNVFLKCSF